MFLLMVLPDHIEALLAVLELIFVGTLLDIVFEQFRNLYVLLAVVAGCNVPALLGQVQVI